MNKTLSSQLEDFKQLFCRPSDRQFDELRQVKLTRGYTQHAEGSVLVEFGATRVLCTASVERGVPRFLRGSGTGWVTAEYSMLPRATHSRMIREAVRGKQCGRTLEIQRLIGRSLRAALDLDKLGENTITLDCDVLQADGGTRTAAITGGYVAMVDAIHVLKQDKHGAMKGNPLKHQVAAVSVGIYKDTPVLDLDYQEDAAAATDMNVVMTVDGGFIEVQGTAEGEPYNRVQMDTMLKLASQGIGKLCTLQQQALA